MKLLLIAAIAITGCNKKVDEPAPGNPGPLPDDPKDPWLHPKAEADRPVVAPPIEPPKPAPPKARPLPTSKLDATVEQLLADLQPLLATSYGAVIHQVSARYVRKDGTLDPKYGQLVIDTTTSPDALDDPARPIGAPLPKTQKVESAECPQFSFAEGTWTTAPRTCHDGEPLTTHCTIAEIWARAIAQKAPDNALAVIDRYHDRNGSYFKIEDAPRKLKIKLYIADDCRPKK